LPLRKLYGVHVIARAFAFASVCTIVLTTVTIGGFSGNGGGQTQYQANHMYFSTGRTISPLEVELNGSLWMPASIAFNADHAGGDQINRGNCKIDTKSGEPTCTNWTRVRGWSSVVGIAPTAIPIGCGDGINAEVC
jgi:hypothetical protein